MLIPAAFRFTVQWQDWQDAESETIEALPFSRYISPLTIICVLCRVLNNRKSSNNLAWPPNFFIPKIVSPTKPVSQEASPLIQAIERAREKA